MSTATFPFTFTMSFGFMALASVLCGLTVVFELKKGVE